jgi:serine/threonine-protein kinase HipA
MALLATSVWTQPVRCSSPTLSPSGSERIGASEIAAHVRQLRTNPEAWLISGHNAGYFLLAGARTP